MEKYASLIGFCVLQISLGIFFKSPPGNLRIETESLSGGGENVMFGFSCRLTNKLW